MTDIKEIIFWIAFVFSMTLLIWNLIGDSPTEFIALVGLIFVVLIKVSSIGERTAKLEIGFSTFKENIQKEINELKK